VDVGGIPNITISRGRTVIRPNGQFPAPPRKRPAGNGHTASEKSFGVVYANDLARAAFATGARFPVGSVIVRERLLNPSDATPQLLAVMIKRAPGFHPKGGDWEFLLVNGSASEVIDRQKKGSCLDCHASQRGKDFVFPISAGK